MANGIADEPVIPTEDALVGIFSISTKNFQKLTPPQPADTSRPGEDGQRPTADSTPKSTEGSQPKK